jgi:outer membrane protein OmpA-like peptidoglycan-associated protein
MRVFIAIIALIMIPVLILVHMVTYNDEMRPRLAAQIVGDLERAGVQKPVAHLSYLDVFISGLAPSLEVRERATEAVTRRPGVRLFAENNHIDVPAQLEMIQTKNTLELSGWLTSEGEVQSVLKMIGTFRPDLTLDAKKLRISHHVTHIGKDKELNSSHPLIAPLLERLRLPAALRIAKKGSTYEITGRVPSEELKDAIVKTAEASAPAWKIEGSSIMSGACVKSAPFTENEPLLTFVTSFFSPPTPGTFSLGEEAPAQMQSDATAELKAEWLSLFRHLNGKKDFKSELRVFSAFYLLPGYKPKSSLSESEFQPLITALAQTQLFFDPGSTEMAETEVEKLKALLPAMQVCGPDLQLVISSWGGPDTETPESQKERAESVRRKLVDLGLSKDQMEIVEFGTLYPVRVLPPGDETAAWPRVELLAR